ncbi:S-crystallin SL11-like [Diadema antillarum]|uniref:S-crystallin SL11-like n=1 Tax=Diadema antillarum TaxID=105358 RepID=UPI003A8480FF
MPSYRLVYFDARGRVEIARLLFALKGVEFDDVRYEFTAFAESEDKKKAPLGQVPILEVEGQPIMLQSRAIQRYLAREFDFYGSNNQQSTFIDIVAETCDEFHEGTYRFLFYETDETKKAELKKKFVEETTPRILSFLEKMLGSTDYFVGDKPSLADVNVLNLVDVGKDHLGEEVFAKHPKLLELSKRVSAIPSVKAYLDKRPKCQY